MKGANGSNVIKTPRFLKSIVLIYATVFVFANWVDFRYVKTLDITTIAGAPIAGSTIMLLVLITEVYGYKLARYAFWFGVLLNIVLLTISQFIPNFPTTDLRLFDGLYFKNSTLIIASILAVFFSQPLAAYLVATLKVKMKGENVVARFFVSTILASGIDSFVVVFIAFYNLVSIHHLVSMILSMWFIKIFIVFIAVPILVILCVRLKAIEKLDIYDKNTDYNLFRLERKYLNSDNLYQVDPNISLKT